jgi:pimeloyl-ACP methyl ester carboxylesterase
MRNGYSDRPFGQIHWRTTGSGDQPDLICLHPVPFTGAALTQIMPCLAHGRGVFAPDYPGYGGSDAFRHDQSIADYAAAIAALIDQVSGGGPMDALGFHTGCLVAVETALTAPDKLLSLALVDVPAYTSEQHREYLHSVARPYGISVDMACLTPAWERGISKRIESQGIERSWEMFVETLRHGRGMNTAFHAGFTYDVDVLLM